MASTELANIEAFKGIKPSQAFTTLDATKDNLASGIGSSYGVISYKGKVWTLRHRGERHTFVRPDDGTPVGHLDVIVLRTAPGKSKSFYDGGYDPNASEGKHPTCASLDGITPDPDVPQQQATACAICPRNAWKVNAEGRKGRDCSDYKRLAVLIVPSQSAAVLGAPLMEPVFLRIPPASLNDLALLGEQMGGQGWHYSTYVTRISFDPDQPHPKMVFKAHQPMSEAEAAVILTMRETPMALRITGEDQLGAGPRPLRLTAAPQSAATAALSGATPLAAPQERLLATPTPKATPITIEATAVKPASPSNMFAGAEGDNGAKIAKGGNAAATVAAKATGPTVQTAADTGEATESDAALDARIAGIIKTT
jgi:hypothetical protein